MPHWIFNLVFNSRTSRGQATPSNGQACLQVPAGVLKIHGLFRTAPKIQPK